MLFIRKHTGSISNYLGRFLIYSGIAIIGLVTIWLSIKVYRVYATYQDLAPHLARLQALASSESDIAKDYDVAQLEESLRQTVVGLEKLSEEVEPFLPLTRYLGWIPIYGGDIQAAPYLLTAGRDVSQAGVILLDDFSPLVETGMEMKQDDLIPWVMATIIQAEADIEQAESLLRQAEANVNAIEVERLSNKTSRKVIPLKRLLPLVISGLQLTKSIPTLLGAESPQTYLILTQNADEIRPSGGYINTAGHVIVDKGQVVEFVMQDSYAVDQLSEEYPYPPDPIYQYMAADYWVLRDAGWSPDFPTTARTAIELYLMGQDVSGAGVIAIDQHALVHLLQALGPIDVEGRQVTSRNVIKLMHRQWAREEGEKFREWWAQRKSFMLALAQTIRQKFEKSPGSINLPVLVDNVQEALAEKHILLYLENPDAADFLTERNWSGALAPVSGDYLMVVDANLGFNKASVVVERQINYQVKLAEDGSAQTRVNLVYRHPARKRAEECSQTPRYDLIYEQNIERCYWNYLRLIVPAGAHLLSGPNVIVAGEYLLRGQATTGEIDLALVGSDKISWGQLFLLAPRESISLDFVYSLPADTAHRKENHWEYSLYLQKQPGTSVSPTEVSITLPEGAVFTASQPQPSSLRKRTLSYQIRLKTDQEIDVSYTIP